MKIILTIREKISIRLIWRRQNGRGAKHHQGFTLVELAIVLVIVGLLIGGILVAQSMIKATKINSFVRQVGQFDAAVENFETKYGVLPGDNTYFGNTGVTVDGGILDSTRTQGNFDGEIARFWYDLSMSGLRNDNGSGYTVGSGNIDIGTEVPISKLSSKAGVLVSGSGLLGNWYTFSKVSGAALSAGGFIPADALSVDKKLDDGVYSTGNVLIAGVVFGLKIAMFPDGVCLSAGGLIITNLTEVCTITIRLGTYTGDLK